MSDLKTIYGYFDNGAQELPTSDPGGDALCPGCGDPVGRDNIKSRSILLQGDYRCYFFCYHADCADDPAIEEAEIALIDQRVVVVEAIENAPRSSTG